MHFCLSLPKASLFLWWWSCHTYVLRQALFLNIRKVFIPKFDVISFCKMHLVSTYIRINMFRGIESNIIYLRKIQRIYRTIQDVCENSISKIRWKIILPIPKGAVTDTELPGIATLDEGFIDFRTKSWDLLLYMFLQFFNRFLSFTFWSLCSIIWRRLCFIFSNKKNYINIY